MERHSEILIEIEGLFGYYVECLLIALTVLYKALKMLCY